MDEERTLSDAFVERVWNTYGSEAEAEALSFQAGLKAAFEKRGKAISDLDIHLLNQAERKWLFRHFPVDFNGGDLSILGLFAWHVAKSVLDTQVEEFEIDLDTPGVLVRRGFMTRRKGDDVEILLAASCDPEIVSGEVTDYLLGLLDNYHDAKTGLLFVWPLVEEMEDRKIARFARGRMVSTIGADAMMLLSLMGMDIEEKMADVDKAKEQYDRARSEATKQRALEKIETAELAIHEIRKKARSILDLPEPQL